MILTFPGHTHWHFLVHKGSENFQITKPVNALARILYIDPVLTVTVQKCKQVRS